MTTALEEKIKDLEDKINQIEAGGSHTVNVFQPEGGGQSSVVVEKTAKGDLKYSIKVYSNDLEGAEKAFDKAVELNKKINGNNKEAKNET